MLETAAKTREKEARQRGNILGILASVFLREPTVAFLEELLASDFLKQMRGLGYVLFNEDQPTPLEPLQEDLWVEYARLFIGPGPHIHPYESLQRGEARLWGEYTVEVKRFYERCGFALAEDSGIIPDHVGAELELLSRLAVAEADHWGKGQEELALNKRRLQTEFLSDHATQWIPFFCDQVAAAASHPFYAGFVSFTKDVLSSIVHELGSAS
ncbi:MAG: molecular chaperone TorD family protein [Thermodesulfobacteriota bacterium]